MHSQALALSGCGLTDVTELMNMQPVSTHVIIGRRSIASTILQYLGMITGVHAPINTRKHARVQRARQRAAMPCNGGLRALEFDASCGKEAIVASAAVYMAMYTMHAWRKSAHSLFLGNACAWIQIQR